MDSAALLDLLGNENRRRILRLLARKPCYVTEISEYLGVSPKAVIDHLRKLEDAGLVESRTDENRRKYFHIARNLRLEVNVSPYDFGTKSAYAASPNLDIATCRYVTIDAAVRARSSDPVGGEAGELEGGEAGELEGGEAGEPVPGSDTEEAPPDAEAAAPESGVEQAAVEEAAADGARVEPADAPSRGESVAGLAGELDRLQDVENELSLAQRWVHGRITEVLDRLSETFANEADARLYTELLASLAGGRRTVGELSSRVDAPRAVVEDALASLAERGVVTEEEGGWVIVE
jgi:ArsR family transcriptional regulator